MGPRCKDAALETSGQFNCLRVPFTKLHPRLNIPSHSRIFPSDSTFSPPIFSRLAKQNLSAPARQIDLFARLKQQIEISPVAAKPLSGSVGVEGGKFLPFAWVEVGDREIIQAVDPSSGEFLIPNLPPETDFITASAPGYYALPQGISISDAALEFQLVPRPETQFISVERWSGSPAAGRRMARSMDLDFN